MTSDEREDVLEAKVAAQRELMDERDRRYEERFKAMDEKTGLALTSSEKAVTKAETATEKRFDAVNEFRGQLKDQASTLISRVEVDARFVAQNEKLESISKVQNMIMGGLVIIQIVLFVILKFWK
jgi:hypothetical protein